MLDEIKKRIQIDLQLGHGAIILEQSDVNWLIEQAEKVEELEKVNNELREIIHFDNVSKKRLHLEIDQLEKFKGHLEEENKEQQKEIEFLKNEIENCLNIEDDLRKQIKKLYPKVTELIGESR